MGVPMFPMVKTADELALEESEVARQEEEGKRKEEEKASALAEHIQKAWHKAVKAKQTVAQEMLESVRRRNGEYSPEKLAQIRQIRSAEVYMMLTNKKCSAVEARIRDIENAQGQRPWDIECTPDPEIPKEMELEIKQDFYRESFFQLLMNSMNSGQPTDMSAIMEQVQGLIPTFEEKLEKLIKEKAMKAAKSMATEIDDKLVEGGFYEALDKCIWDIATLKAAILKGPVPRYEMVRVQKTNPITGTMEVVTEQRVVWQYDRVSPFDAFPAPGSTGINHGDFIEREYFWPSQLDGLIGLPGYKENEIRAVLREWDDGTLKDWATDIDQERIEQEKQQKDTDINIDLSQIPCLEWWGEVSGNKLMDWGVTEGVTDKDRIYNAVGWLIGSHVIKAKINPDPTGNKPYSKASYEQFPNSFWGRSPAELLKSIQDVCNACARAIVNNIGIASGPMVEANKDRFPDGYDFTLWPWKVWISDESTMGSDKPALQFWAPPLVVDKLINVYTTFSKLADEYIIPAYAHGDSQVGGAGNTASGFSMLMGGALIGIKDVIKHMDMYLVGPTIERQFFSIIENKPRKGIIGDMKVVTRGASYLAVKQEEAMRLMEFARNTVNEIDFMLQGPDGRKYVLKRAAQSMNIDPDKAFPEQLSAPMNPMAQMLLPPGNNQPAPRNLDAAGNPVKGTDTRRFNQEGK